MSVFKKDDKVTKRFTKFEPRYDLEIGKVVSVSKNKALVKWKSSYKYPNPQEILESELMFYSDANKKWTELEKEFAIVEQQLKVKVAMATALLDEASQIAKANGYVLSQLDVGYTVIDAINSAGWRTSSLNC